ncbi:MAG: hypothetical protein KDK97_05180 [Verrucomicrobiales bacterium]|nr:hypothetical protein [Verrucomicrobiales bacterium]MCP5557631.1 hypothetical protein [Verrucomicrobiaceae bacterium]
MRYLRSFLASFLCTAPWVQARTWMDDMGRKVEAEFGGIDGQNAVLIMPGGTKSAFPLAKLSAADRDFIASQSKPAETVAEDLKMPDYSKVPPPAPHPPLERRLWPVEVIVTTGAVNPFKVPSPPDKSIFRVGKFQFEMGPDLSVPVIKEVTRTFVAIEELIDRLPWDLRPTPANGDFFIAKLYQSGAEYVAIAPPNSGGFYSLTEKVFHVPYSSLGIVRDKKKGWVTSGRFKSDTLVHELTHMMMDRIVGYLPIWVAEGSAEYVETIPFSDTGVLRPGDIPKAMPAYILEMTKLPKGLQIQSPLAASAATMVRVMHMSHKEWHAYIDNAPEPLPPPPGYRLMGNPEIGTRQRDLYLNACLLFYYFLHLDNGKNLPRGEPMLSYFDAVQDTVPKWQMWDRARDHFNEEVTRYNAAIQEFKKQPGVEDLGNGRIQFPRGLTPPKAPKLPPPPYDLDKVNDRDPGLTLIDHLIKGRSDEELAAAFKTGFATIGITLLN